MTVLGSLDKICFNCDEENNKIPSAIRKFSFPDVPKSPVNFTENKMMDYRVYEIDNEVCFVHYSS